MLGATPGAAPPAASPAQPAPSGCAGAPPVALALTDADLARLWPAHILIDAEGTIRGCGPSLARMAAAPLVGRALFDVALVERPAGLACAADLAGLDQPLILSLIGPEPLRLRGLCVGQTAGFALLLGHLPAAQEVAASTGLGRADFGPADAAPDLLLAAELRRGALEDVRALAATLAADKAAAEAASAAKSDLLAGVSHEIRTPMNGVLGMASVLARTDLRADQQDMLNVMIDAGQSLLTVLDDILDLARIDRGPSDAAPTPFDLGRMVRASAALHRPAAEAKGLTFELRVAPEAERTWAGDPARLRQILDRLLSNAVRFTPRGAVGVEVDVVCDAPDAPALLRMTVADSGPGLDAEAKGLLLQPFLQADRAPARPAGGAGLGLAIVQSLARRMGGAVALDAGAGARFVVEIPLLSAPPPSRADLGDAEPALRPLRVLVAEDNATNQTVIAAFLSRLGHDFVLAPDGQAAIEAWGAGPFDVVLMDMRMPVLDGMDAVAIIRRRERTQRRPRTPIIALSADVLGDVRARGAAAGCDAFLTKPTDVATLARALAKAVADADRRAASFSAA